MGVSGSGKTVIGTQLARALGVEFVEGDSYHPAENIEKMSAGIALSDLDREGWLHAIGARIRTANETGKGVVVSCSALKRSYRDVLRKDGGSVQFIFLRGEPALIAERVRGRKNHFMPAALLDSQFAALEEPAQDEDIWTVDVSATPQGIVSSLLSRARA